MPYRSLYVAETAPRRLMLSKYNSHVDMSINKTGDSIGTTSRDIPYKIRGLVAELTSAFGSDDVSDKVLEDRVRSKIGRVVSDSSSIEVTADQGRVTLRGPVLEREIDGLLTCVSRVRGVTEFNNQLEPHKQADGVPGLQGGSRCPGERIDLLQNNWSPTTRLLAGVAGGALVISAIKRQEQRGLPKVARVAQREAFKVLKQCGALNASARSVHSELMVGGHSGPRSSQKLLSPSEIKDTAEICL